MPDEFRSLMMPKLATLNLRRGLLPATISIMASIAIAANNARILHDFDIYHTTLINYEQLRYRLSAETGFVTKQNTISLKHASCIW